MAKRKKGMTFIPYDYEAAYNQYFANMEVDKDIVAQIGDAEVKRFRAIPEITHRKYKERGLIAPMKPEETPDYSFRDLQLCMGCRSTGNYNV